MKINFNYFEDKAREKLHARIDKQDKWLDYFAWWPTKVGRSDWRWFEQLERREYYNGRTVFAFWSVEYRVKEKQ